MEMVKVMLVDDKQYNIEMLSEKLQYIDNIEIVATANNGSQALDVLSKLETLPTIVFMDLEMPVMDGLTAISQGKALYPGVYFVVNTVFDTDDKIMEALQLGASGYLLKDTKIDALTRAIEDVLNFGAAPLSAILAQKIYNFLHIKNDAGRKTNPLSKREVEILQLLSQSKSYTQIATELFISPHTVRKHITNLYEKLQVNSKIQAVQMAVENKWV